MGNVAGINNVCMVRCQNPQGPFGGCVPIQMGGNVTATANPIMSQTGGTAEDDIDAIVEAAEDGEDGDDGRGDGGSRGGLFSLFNRSKTSQMSEAKRERLQNQEAVRAKRLARKQAAQA